MKRSDILIEVDELLAKINNPNIRIYDATINFFTQDGEQTAHDKYLEAHLPNAAFFDHDQVSDRNSPYRYMILPEAELSAQIGEMGIANDAEVIVYTSSIFACATRAWWVLRYAGHNNVRVLNGGLQAWQEAGGAIATGGKTYASTTFETNLRPEMFATKEDVQAAQSNNKVNVEYTLDVEAYGGIYIPQSTFLPAGQLMEGESMMTANKLIADDAILTKLKLDDAYQRTITYCGGGIAATVNAIAHLIAGNENIAVYDGSLGEWMGEKMPTEKLETTQE